MSLRRSGRVSRVVAVRVPQAERTARMRERLARAAFEVIRDGGYVNFRTAAVATAAGVSQGAQLHHYPTKHSLAEAAIEYAYAQSGAASLARVQAPGAETDPLRALLDDSRAFFLSDYFRVALDILMAGGGDVALREALIRSTLRHRQQVERLWLERLLAAGWSLTDAEDLLALTLSMVRGLAIRALVEPAPERIERLCERWYAIALAALPSGRGT